MDQGEDIGEIPLPIEINIADKKEKGEYRASGFRPSFFEKSFLFVWRLCVFRLFCVHQPFHVLCRNALGEIP